MAYDPRETDPPRGTPVGVCPECKQGRVIRSILKDARESAMSQSTQHFRCDHCGREFPSLPLG